MDRSAYEVEPCPVFTETDTGVLVSHFPARTLVSAELVEMARGWDSPWMLVEGDALRFRVDNGAAEYRLVEMVDEVTWGAEWVRGDRGDAPGCGRMWARFAPKAAPPGVSP